MSVVLGLLLVDTVEGGYRAWVAGVKRQVLLSESRCFGVEDSGELILFSPRDHPNDIAF